MKTTAVTTADLARMQSHNLRIKFFVTRPKSPAFTAVKPLGNCREAMNGYFSVLSV